MRLMIIGDKHFYSSVTSRGASKSKMHRHRNLDGSRGGLVSETAKVSKTVYVGSKACVDGTAQVSGKVRLLDHAYVSHQAKVFGSVVVSENAHVGGNSEIKGRARISGYALVDHYARVSGSVKISGHVMIQGVSEIRGNGSIDGHLVIGSWDGSWPKDLDG